MPPPHPGGEPSGRAERQYWERLERKDAHHPNWSQPFQTSYQILPIPPRQVPLAPPFHLPPPPPPSSQVTFNPHTHPLYQARPSCSRGVPGPLDHSNNPHHTGSPFHPVPISGQFHQWPENSSPLVPSKRAPLSPTMPPKDRHRAVSGIPPRSIHHSDDGRPSSVPPGGKGKSPKWGTPSFPDEDQPEDMPTGSHRNTPVTAVLHVSEEEASGATRRTETEPADIEWHVSGDDEDGRIPHSAPTSTPAPAEGAGSTWTGSALQVNQRGWRRADPVNSVMIPKPRRWGEREGDKTGDQRTASTPAVDNTRGWDVKDSQAEKRKAPSPAVDDGGWGVKGSSTEQRQSSGPLNDEGNAVKDRLKQWVDEIKPGLPIPVANLPSAPSVKAPSEASSLDLSRPDSARQELPPVSLVYSEDDDAESLKIVKKKPHRCQEGDTEAEVPVDNESIISAATASRYPSHLVNNRPRPRPFSRQSVASTQLTTFGGSGHRRRYGDHRVSQTEKWWKRETHPTVCPSFASRRLVVMIPFPIRREELKRAMYDHFSRYGPIRCAVPTNVNDDASDKVIIVFKKEDSVEAVLADPKREECEFRSSYSRSGPSKFQLRVIHYPLPSLTYVWVKVSGPRFDSRSRSASPLLLTRDDGGWGDDNGTDTRTLPESVQLYAVPRFLHKSQTWVYRATILKRPLQVVRAECNTAVNGMEPIFLTEFHLGRRVSEKDFVPQLVDYFVDIFEIVPPGETTSGWVFGVAGEIEARHLMDQLAALPGITARFARSSDRSSFSTELSPTHTSSPLDAEESPEEGATVHSSSDHAASVKPVTINPHANLPLKPTTKLPPLEDICPGLVPQTVLTYRGRLIREETVDGCPRYIDDAAIFVGRLVKEQETTMSLLQRFERYGKIVSVEYNPMTSQSTYGTARVLFQDATAAKEAIEFENGTVSFGSAIKVEARKVLPMDVQVRNMYIDTNGRAISPSMAHQYSPPPAAEPAAPSFPSRRNSAQISQTANTYPPPWYSVMGPQFWTPQMPLPSMSFMGPSTIPSGSEVPPQSPLPPIMPMMCHVGVGFYTYPYQVDQQKPNLEIPRYPVAPVATESVPTLGAPAHIPTVPSTAEPAFPESMAALSILQSRNPVASAAPNDISRPATGAAPSKEVPLPTTAIANADSSSRVLDNRGAQGAPSDGDNPDSKTQLRAVGAKFEDGVYKLIYDPEQLKQWREEHHLPGSPPPAPYVPPPPPPTESPMLPLLPLSTGGHEPHRHKPSDTSEYADFFRLANMTPSSNAGGGWSNELDRGVRRSQYLHSPSNRFPEPIGGHLNQGMGRQPGTLPNLNVRDQSRGGSGYNRRHNSRAQDRYGTRGNTHRQSGTERRSPAGPFEGSHDAAADRPAATVSPVPPAAEPVVDPNDPTGGW